MVRFFVIESIYLVSNLRFNMHVVYLRLIIFLIVYDVLVNSETLFARLHKS
jgi:hypothetical protein